MQATIKSAVYHNELETIFNDAELALVAEYADNIERLYRDGDAELRASGLYWYDEANLLARRLAAQTGLSVEQTASVLAVLSPCTSWSNQVNFTLAFIEAVLAGADAHSVRAPFTGANKIKAGRIIAGDLSALRGVKVEMFYANIMGENDCATVDRHALRIALGREATSLECASILTAKSRQRLCVVAAYHLAAKRLGHGVANVQAATWTIFRGTAH
jgi:hypothetical protein